GCARGRRRPGQRLGADPPAVAGEGTRHRLLPGQARCPAAFLGAGHHRDRPAPSVLVGGRPYRRAAGRVRGGAGETVSAGGGMLSGIEGRFSHAVIAFLDDDGYPLSVAADFELDVEHDVLTLSDPPGAVTRPPEDRDVTVTFSHIRPQPGVGYDERRYVSLWGRLDRRGGRLILKPVRERHWDEQEMTFFE